MFLANLAFAVATVALTSTTSGGAFVFSPLEIAFLAVSGASMIGALIEFAWNQHLWLQTSARLESEKSEKLAAATTGANQSQQLSPGVRRRATAADDYTGKHDLPPPGAAVTTTKNGTDDADASDTDTPVSGRSSRSS